VVWHRNKFIDHFALMFLVLSVRCLRVRISWGSEPFSSWHSWAVLCLAIAFNACYCLLIILVTNKDARRNWETHEKMWIFFPQYQKVTK
jgi:hypothetical protein